MNIINRLVTIFVFLTLAATYICITAQQETVSNSNTKSQYGDDDLSPRIECYHDYSPCSCDMDNETLSVYIYCYQVPFKQIQEAFETGFLQFVLALEIVVSPNETDRIPANFLGDHRVIEMRLTCPSDSDLPIIIDSDGFKASADYNTKFVTSYCNFSQQEDLKFLTGFNNLRELSFFYCNDMQSSFATLPELVALERLTLSYGNGLDAFPQLSRPPLQYIDLSSNQLDDRAVENLMNSVKGSISLQHISLNGNYLTRVPSQLASLPSLTELYTNYNNISQISANELTFSSAIEILSITNDNINLIEPGAFQGYFGYTFLTLYYNNLKVLDEAVFKAMLMDMVDTGEGYLYIIQNPIACDCTLAWLIRDNRNLLKAIPNGSCSNYTSFNDLDPNGFNGCP